MCSSKCKLYWSNLFFESNSGHALNSTCSRIHFQLLGLSYTKEREKIRGNEMDCTDEKKTVQWTFFICLFSVYLHEEEKKQNKMKTGLSVFRSLFL